MPDFLYCVFYLYLISSLYVTQCNGNASVNVNANEEEIPYEPSTRNDFEQFKNTLPKNILTSPIQSQEVLLQLIDLYVAEKNQILPYEIFHERENRVYNYATLTNQLNIAILFIGFPANAISRMRELWFNKLTRMDHIHGMSSSSSSPEEEVLHTSSRVHLKHNFHLIETSHHLESALIRYFDSIAFKKSPISDDTYYVNAWEVDDILNSLKDKLFESDPIKPDLTFCILNLEMFDSKSTSPTPPKYSYKNGFSQEEMIQMKKSDPIRHAAGIVVRTTPHKSRVIIDESQAEFPLHADSPSVSSSSSSSSSTMSEEIKFETDKIRASQLFATTLTSQLENEGEVTLVQRILAILSNDRKNSVYSHYKHILAREILSDQMQSTFDESESLTQERLYGIDRCDTDLWTGMNGLVWLDVRATEVPPVTLSGAPYSSHSHQPLEYHELLRKSSSTSHTGTDHRPEDTQHEYNSLIHSIQQHLTHCNELLFHLTPKCPTTRTLYDISPIATPEIRLFDFQQIVRQIHSSLQDGEEGEENLPYCGLLLVQKTFLDAVLEISIQLSNLIQTEMKLDHNFDDYVYYNDAMNFHNRILSEVLEVSSMFVGKGHFSQIGFSSPSLNHAIARFGAIVLGLSRQLISRPILLHEKQQLWSNQRPQGMKEVKRRRSLISPSGEQTALTYLTTLHEMTRYYDELTNTSLFSSPSSSSSSTQSESTIRPVGVSFYGEDQSQLLVDEDMNRWGSLLPPVYIPQYVEVEIFIIKMQNTYEPIDDEKSFNMPIFLKEIEKLKLPNQQLTISTHIVNGADEPILALSLEGCRRTQVKRNSLNEIKETEFLSGECVWGHLQQQEQTPDQQSGAGADSISEKLNLFRKKQHLAIFFLSLDVDQPVFLKKEGSKLLQTSLTFDDTILVIQNQQTYVRQELKCGDHFIYDNLRNPLGVALRSVGSALLGMHIPVLNDPLSNDKKSSHRIVTTCGGSPHFGSLSGATPLFNQFDIESSHRGRLLRSLEYVVWMSSRNQEDILFLHDHSLRIEGVDSQVTKTMEAIQQRQWSKAASLLNSLLRIIYQQKEKIEKKKISKILELQLLQTKERSGPSSASSPSPFLIYFKTICFDFFMATCLSGFLSLLLFLFFSLAITRFKLSFGGGRR